jgi:hypothetical protein
LRTFGLHTRDTRAFDIRNQGFGMNDRRYELTRGYGGLEFRVSNSARAGSKERCGPPAKELEILLGPEGRGNLYASKGLGFVDPA